MVLPDQQFVLDLPESLKSVVLTIVSCQLSLYEISTARLLNAQLCDEAADDDARSGPQ